MVTRETQQILIPVIIAMTFICVAIKVYRRFKGKGKSSGRCKCSECREKNCRHSF